MSTGLNLLDRLPLEIRFMIYRQCIISNSSTKTRPDARTILCDQHEDRYQGSSRHQVVVPLKGLENVSAQINVEMKAAVFESLTFHIGTQYPNVNDRYLRCVTRMNASIEVGWIKNLALNLSIPAVVFGHHYFVPSRWSYARSMRQLLFSLETVFIILFVDLTLLGSELCAGITDNLVVYLEPWKDVKAVRIYLLRDHDRRSIERVNLLAESLLPKLSPNMTLLNDGKVFDYENLGR